ncbi:MAG TPA: response regulator [Terriglobia bacterium]|nr:response regulator [Terriglobia bacterium]
MAQKATVMVVEDDAVLRRALAELLQIWGYEAETASDGLEALDKIRACPPVVVISDLLMPRMGGIELLQALRVAVPNVSCIILTAAGSPENAVQAVCLGAVDFIEKPLDPERLRSDLRMCFAHSEPPAVQTFLR